MLRIIDRYVVKTFFRAYVICFLSLVGLYIVIDAISNLDEFAKAAEGFGEVLGHMGRFYLYRLSLFFDMLSGIITVVAAMFTVTWMKRHNEIIPLLSCGVSAYRVVFPVVVAAVLVNVGTVANQELIMPQIADHLRRKADDPYGMQRLQTAPVTDRRGVVLASRGDGDPKLEHVSDFVCIIPTPDKKLSFLTARDAYWRDDGQRKGWFLDGLGPKDYPTQGLANVHVWGRGQAFVETEKGFRQMTRVKRWYQFLSSSELWSNLQDPSTPRRRHMMVAFHMRITKPLMNIILVFLGLPFVLNRYDSNAVISLGICVVLCALFFMTVILCQALGNAGDLSPTLAAWLPVIVFFVIAIGVFDTVKT